MRRRPVAASAAPFVIPVSVAGIVLNRTDSLPLPGLTNRPHVQSVAVMPLRKVSADSGNEYFAEGITDLLTAELARLRQVRIIFAQFAPC